MKRGEETIFSKILRGEIPAKKVLETDRVLAFHDIQPQAPVHVLVIPKEAMRNLNEATSADATMLGELLLGARQVAEQLGIAESGYRVVINNGSGVGQTVSHLHLHVLGGRAFGWPTG